MMTATTGTREEWLRWGVDELRPLFKQASYELPKVLHVSVGFPSRGATSNSRRVVGQCWNSGSSDGASHIFISPVLATGVQALDTLVHELVHVVTPGAGHKSPFIKAGNSVGLTAGKPTSRGAGPELLATLERLNGESPYPHSALTASGKLKKQSTRLLKVECGDCGYVCRVTQKWLDTAGAPCCPIHETQMEVA